MLREEVSAAAGVEAIIVESASGDPKIQGKFNMTDPRKSPQTTIERTGTKIMVQEANTITMVQLQHTVLFHIDLKLISMFRISITQKEISERNHIRLKDNHQIA